MAELNIEKFNPTLAEIQGVVAEAKALTLPDPKDKAQLQKVHDARIKLRNIRTGITKTGKVMREDAVKFQKAVIEKEREFVALVEPEETRLEALESEAKRIQDREDRREFLPARKARLEALADGVALPTDDEILDMDGTAFEGYFNKRSAEHNERVRQANEAKSRELQAEEDRKRREQEETQRKEREAAQAKERRKLSRAQRLMGKGYAPTEAGMTPPATLAALGLATFTPEEISEADDATFEQKFAKVVLAIEEQERKEQQAEQERIKAEKQAKDKRYQDFLAQHGYNSKEFYTTQETDGTITLWKKVATYDPYEHE